MAEKTFRNKIYWFTFLFSVLVIWVHSYNAVLFLGNTGAAASLVRLERFFGDKIAQIAVPGFFMELPDQERSGSVYRVEQSVLFRLCDRKQASLYF